MPSLHLPGEMMPGQLGPISRERRFCRNSQARTISSVGMPSVMQTISSTSASAASMMASAANGGGTKIIEASAPVLSTASCTLLKMGQPSCVVPPLPGVTPPTMLVPYSAQAFGMKCAFTAGESLHDDSSRFIYQNAHECLPILVRAGRRNYFFGSVFHSLRDNEIQPRLL